MGSNPDLFSWMTLVVGYLAFESLGILIYKTGLILILPYCSVVLGFM